jgi:hypothetical protein
MWLGVLNLNCACRLVQTLADHASFLILGQFLDFEELWREMGYGG